MWPAGLYERDTLAERRTSRRSYCSRLSCSNSRCRGLNVGYIRHAVEGNLTHLQNVVENSQE